MDLIAQNFVENGCLFSSPSLFCLSVLFLLLLLLYPQLGAHFQVHQ